MPTYNLREVVIGIAGIRIEGFGESDAVTIERNEDIWVQTMGADGEMTWSKTNNDGAIATLNLMQTSQSNAILQTAQILDDAAGDRSFAFWVREPATGWILGGIECRIMGSPSKPFNKQAGEIQWRIGIAHLKEYRLNDDFLDDFGGLGGLTA